MQTSAKLIELRQFLSERLPKARFGFAAASTAAEVWPTGASALDRTLGGGLAEVAFSELVGIGDGSGSPHVLHAPLRQVEADGLHRR